MWFVWQNCTCRKTEIGKGMSADLIWFSRRRSSFPSILLDTNEFSFKKFLYLSSVSQNHSGVSIANIGTELVIGPLLSSLLVFEVFCFVLNLAGWKINVLKFNEKLGSEPNLGVFVVSYFALKLTGNNVI